MNPRCGIEHPDDFGPIQRRCARTPGHEGAHMTWGYGHPNWTDQWPNNEEAS